MRTLKGNCCRIGIHLPLPVFLLCTATIICGGCFAQEEQKETSRSSVEADRAFADLMSATAYSELEKMTIRWEKELSDQAKVKLIKVLQTGVLRNDPEPQRITLLEGKGVTTRHDLTLPAGRAVWTIERLFGISLPPVQSGLSGEPLYKIYSIVTIGVDKWAREKVKTRLATMSKSERLEQARSPNPLIYPEEALIILDLLADDPEPEIRMEILSSRWLQYHTVMRRLEEEQNPDIRKKLEPFKYYAYTMPRDLPKPEGW